MIIGHLKHATIIACWFISTLIICESVPGYIVLFMIVVIFVRSVMWAAWWDERNRYE